MNAIQPKTFKHWWNIKFLHNTTFSGQDRKSFSIYRSRQEIGKVDIWYFEEDGRFAGYAIITPGKKQVLINYIAVAASMRGKHKSKEILAFLQETYAGRGLFAEVDYISPTTLHRQEKERRRNFYLTNGFTQLGVTATYVDTDLELVGLDCPMTFESYYRFYAENYNLYTATCIGPCKAAQTHQDAVYD